MTRGFARVLSYLLHPVVYPVLGVLVTLKFLPYYTHSRIVILSLALVFTGTYIFPLVASLLFYKVRVISSLEMREARDRRWPYVIGAISYYFTAVFIRTLQLPEEAYLYLLASALIIILHLALLRFSKLSAHLAGIGGFTGLLLAVSWKYQVGLLPYIALCFLLAGFLASARLKLESHVPGEVVWGYLSGLFIVSGLILLA